MPAPRKFKDPLKKPGTPEPQPRIRSVPVSKLVASPSGAHKEGPPTQEPIKRELASGTPKEPVEAKNAREVLKRGWTNLGHRTMAWLQEEGRLEALLEETKLKDIGVFAGITTEKILLLEGQPTQIIAQPQQAVLDKLGPALAEVMKQRGLVKLTERTIEMKPPQ